MAALSSIPVWLQSSKAKVQKSDQWLAFSKTLFDLVTEQMYENGIRSFTELSPKEQKLLVMKAVSQLKNDPEYRDLLQHMSSTMDIELSQELRKISRQKSQSQSKTALLSQTFDIALDSLLTKWPEMHSQFKPCLNEIIKPSLRYIMWKSCIQNLTLKNEYLRIVSTSPKNLVSHSDFEIAQKSQTLLNSDQLINNLGQIKGAPSIMRHLLSYYHVTLNKKEGLTEVDYNLAVPFVNCTMTSQCKEVAGVRQVLTTEDLATLVEQFLLFMKRRSQYMTSVVFGPKSQILTLKMTELLKEKEPKLMDFITKVYSKAFDTDSQECLWRLFQPMLRSLFVGYVSINTAMFIWDQFVITLDVEKVDPIPYICAAMLLSLKKEIAKVKTWRDLTTTVITSLNTLQSERLRGVLIDSKLSEKMKAELNEELEKNTMQFQPTHTSVLANLQPWRRWYSDKLIQHYRSLKRAPIQQLNGDLARGSSAEKDTVQDLEVERENLIEEMHLMKTELFETKRALNEEERQKFEIQDRADQEIERLRRQLDLAKNATALNVPLPTSKIGLSEPLYDDSETSSVASLRTPPPSIATEKLPTPKPAQTPVKDPTPIPSPIQTPVIENEVTEKDGPSPTPGQEQTVNIMRDLVKRTLLAANILAHGTGRDAENLNEGSKRDLLKMRVAYEQAMLDVFGQKLSDEQLANLPPDGRQKQLLTEAIKKNLLKPK